MSCLQGLFLIVLVESFRVLLMALISLTITFAFSSRALSAYSHSTTCMFFFSFPLVLTIN